MSAHRILLNCISELAEEIEIQEIDIQRIAEIRAERDELKKTDSLFNLKLEEQKRIIIALQEKLALPSIKETLEKGGGKILHVHCTKHELEQTLSRAYNTMEPTSQPVWATPLSDMLYQVKAPFTILFDVKE